MAQANAGTARQKAINVPGYKGPERRNREGAGLTMQISATELERMVTQRAAEVVAAGLPKLIGDAVHRALQDAQRTRRAQATAPGPVPSPAPGPNHAQQMKAEAGELLQRTGEQNGVKAPGPGKCKDVWDALDVQVRQGQAVTVARAREIAEANGWNPRNAQVEFYRWKRYTGYRPPVTQQPDAAPAQATPEPAPQPQADAQAPAPAEAAPAEAPAQVAEGDAGEVLPQAGVDPAGPLAPVLQAAEQLTDALAQVVHQQGLPDEAPSPAPAPEVDVHPADDPKAEPPAPLPSSHGSGNKRRKGRH